MINTTDSTTGAATGEAPDFVLSFKCG